MRRKALVTVSAMMLAAQLGSPLTAAEPSAEQLATIAGLLEANDVSGLRGYLSEHPELAQGDSTLALLLRRFLVESAAASYFRFEPDLSDSLDTAVGGVPTAGDDDGPRGGPPSQY
jgi:hypothetical protein